MSCNVAKLVGMESRQILRHESVTSQLRNIIKVRKFEEGMDER